MVKATLTGLDGGAGCDQVGGSEARMSKAWFAFRRFLRMFPFGFTLEKFQHGRALLRVQRFFWTTWEVWDFGDKFVLADFRDALEPLPSGSSAAYHRIDFMGCKVYAGDDIVAAQRHLSAERSPLRRRGLHDVITDACAAAGPAILRATDGSEASIYNLRFAVADLMDALERDGGVVDSLKAKGLTLRRDPVAPNKHA